MDIKRLQEYFENVEYSYSSLNIKQLVTNEFIRFINIIRTIPELEEFSDKIENICKDIELIINKYECGYIFNSYDCFSDMMRQLSDNLESIIVNGKKPDKFLNKDFYRMRMSESILNEKKEIFHTPISLRRKINTQRYSVSGLPCLYLSSSVYTCWTEMNKPKINDLHVSRFIFDDLAIVNILNFTMIDPKRLFYKDHIHLYQGDDMMYIERIDPKLLIDALILWPLLFVCSLRGSEINDFYKPEYIVPQFLLQWVRKNANLKGIAYFSTDTNPKNVDPYYSINYVFPVDDAENEICSYLSSIFKLTDPYRCDVIENIFSGVRSVSPDFSHRKFQDKKYSGLEIHYENTKYGKIERYLQLFDPEKV